MFWVLIGILLLALVVYSILGFNIHRGCKNLMITSAQFCRSHVVSRCGFKGLKEFTSKLNNMRFDRGFLTAGRNRDYKKYIMYFSNQATPMPAESNPLHSVDRVDLAPLSIPKAEVTIIWAMSDGARFLPSTAVLPKAH